MRPAMDAAAALRSLTHPLHEQVDAAFAGLGLTDAASYCAFLHAHALALPAAEAAMAPVAALPAWRPRAPLLQADLADLGMAMPEPLPFATAKGEAASWGVFYVVEGSRLGGAMLARQVGAGLPRRYLAAVHLPGEWREQRAAIDAAGAAGGEGWAEAAAAGAGACFALYARAARAAADAPPGVTAGQ